MSSNVMGSQENRTRMGLEPVRLIIVVNPWHVALAMLTGAVVLFALISFGLIPVPAVQATTSTAAVVGAGVLFALIGWVRLIRNHD